MQRPGVILALGAFVPPFLAPLSPELSKWATCHSFRALDSADLATIAAAAFPAADHVLRRRLTHPCLRQSNVLRQRWQSYEGDRAELEMVRETLRVGVGA